MRASDFDTYSIETLTDGQGRRRHRLLREVQTTPDSRAGIATVYDASDTDILIKADAIFLVGELIQITSPNDSGRTAMVIWTQDQLVGCKFIQTLTADTRNAQQSIATESDTALLDTQGVYDCVDGQSATATSGKLSLGIRIWTIIVLAGLLWTIIGALAFWITS